MSNDLTKPDSEILKVDSLDDLQKAPRENLVESLVVLVDSSGSMADTFHSGSESKQAAAQRAMDILWEKTDWGICEMRVFSFDDDSEQVVCSDSERPILHNSGGGTSFSNPLQAALDTNPTRIILASDGEASFPNVQVATCIDQGIPVDTIFIQGRGYGDYPQEGYLHGEALLRQISEQTGGQFTVVDDAENLVSAFAELETSVRLQLSYQPEEEEEKSVIKL